MNLELNLPPGHAFVTMYVIGPTNSGKTSFLAAVKDLFQDQVGLIEVGKILRAKYPPEHFKGQNNPAHTAVEAWQIFTDLHRQYISEGKKVILSDGQPRDTKQTQVVLERGDAGECQVFLHLWAPMETRVARAHLRDGHDPAKLELSRQRLINDEPANYNVLSRVLAAQRSVYAVDTSAPGFNTVDTFRLAVQGAR